MPATSPYTPTVIASAIVDQHHHLLHERRVGDGAQRDDDDLGRQDEVGADRALDLVFLERHQVDRRVGQRADQFGVVRGILFGAVQELVRQLLDSPRSRGTRRRPSAAA